MEGIKQSSISQSDLFDYLQNNLDTSKKLSYNNTEDIANNKTLSHIKIDSLLIDNTDLTFNANTNNIMDVQTSRQTFSNKIGQSSQLPRREIGSFMKKSSPLIEKELFEALGLNENDILKQKNYQVEDNQKKNILQFNSNSNAKLMDQIIILKKTNKKLQTRNNQLENQFLKFVQFYRTNQQNISQTVRTNQNKDGERVIQILLQKLQSCSIFIHNLEQQMKLLHKIKTDLVEKVQIQNNRYKNTLKNLHCLQTQNKELQLKISQHLQYNKQIIKKISILETNSKSKQKQSDQKKTSIKLVKYYSEIHQEPEEEEEQNSNINSQLTKKQYSSDTDDIESNKRLCYDPVLELKIRRLRDKNERYRLKAKRYKQQKQTALKQFEKYIIHLDQKQIRVSSHRQREKLYTKNKKKGSDSIIQRCRQQQKFQLRKII